MQKDTFIQLIKDYKQWETNLHKLGKLFKASVFESELFTYTDEIFSCMLNECFTCEGVDTIDWWLYEKPMDKSLCIKDKKGNIVPTETVEDLWEIVKYNQK